MSNVQNRKFWLESEETQGLLKTLKESRQASLIAAENMHRARKTEEAGDHLVAAGVFRNVIETIETANLTQ